MLLVVALSASSFDFDDSVFRNDDALAETLWLESLDEFFLGSDLSLLGSSLPDAELLRSSSFEKVFVGRRCSSLTTDDWSALLTLMLKLVLLLRLK